MGRADDDRWLSVRPDGTFWSMRHSGAHLRRRDGVLELVLHDCDQVLVLRRFSEPEAVTRLAAR